MMEKGVGLILVIIVLRIFIGIKTADIVDIFVGVGGEGACSQIKTLEC
jgi:hypothetical protein